MHPQPAQFTFVERRMQQVHAVQGELLRQIVHSIRIVCSIRLFFLQLFPCTFPLDKQGKSLMMEDRRAGGFPPSQKRKDMTA